MVLVSFRCYNFTIFVNVSNGMFQFLFVVTALELDFGLGNRCFSFFSLLLELNQIKSAVLLFQFLFVVTLKLTGLQSLKQFQFLFVVTFTSYYSSITAYCFSFFSLLHAKVNFDQNKRKVLVSFRCYSIEDLLIRVVIMFQFLFVVTPFFLFYVLSIICFSFFSLLQLPIYLILVGGKLFQFLFVVTVYVFSAFWAFILFQFLFVVTVDIFHIYINRYLVLVSFRCYTNTCFEIKLLIKVLVSFRCYRRLHTEKLHTYQVLVSFRCYIMREKYVPTYSRFQFLFVVTSRFSRTIMLYLFQFLFVVTCYQSFLIHIM